MDQSMRKNLNKMLASPLTPSSDSNSESSKWSKFSKSRPTFSSNFTKENLTQGDDAFQIEQQKSLGESSNKPKNKPCCHHRPRIKLKPNSKSPLTPNSLSLSSVPLTPCNCTSKIKTATAIEKSWRRRNLIKYLLLRPLINPPPQVLLLTIALVTFGVSLLSLLPGACATQINSNLNSTLAPLIITPSSVFMSKSTGGEKTQSSALTLENSVLFTTKDFTLKANNNNNQLVEQEEQKQNINSQGGKNIHDANDAKGNNNVVEGDSISDSRVIRTEIDNEESDSKSTLPPPALIMISNLRPLTHFNTETDLLSSANIANSKQNSEIQTVTSPEDNGDKNAAISSSSTNLHVIDVELQADDPGNYADNKGETEPGVSSPNTKIAKSSKSKSLERQVQPPSLTLGQTLGHKSQSVILDLDEEGTNNNNNNILTSTNSLQKIPNVTQTQTLQISGYFLNSTANSNRIESLAASKNNAGVGGLILNLKPRRLESLSYGVKNRISNAIPFEDEEYDANSKGLNSNGSLASQNLGIGLGLGVGVGSGSVGSTFRSRSPLQIRRDLSRLVSKAAKGNEIYDETLSKCDRLYVSTPNGPKNGTFESPSLPLEEGHLYTCMLMFVARPNERVDISFRNFKVRGTPPECVHEWVDIWTEVEGTDPTDLITTPFSGRYCGRIPPRKRISLYGGIAIGFYSDKNTTDEPIFHGTYAFINESRYVVGTPVPRTLCSYTILASSNKGIGELLSPTYPGVYPKNLSCSYKFVGSEGQRIRIEFRDFDVFYGGAHCPFDDVKIYDGSDPTAPLIGTYCGQQRNLVVYSSEHTMLVTFTTLDRNTDSQNRGFNAVYEFSNSFVKLDFIERNMGDHIRGTECDQRILSKGQSTGVVYSPNYPFPYLPKIVCRYFIYGLQDPQNLERVRLSFEMFDVPSFVNSAEDEINQSDAKRCGDAFLKVYLKGQEVIQAYDKADFEFCGKDLPHAVVSDGPRMVLVFSSGETAGTGFKGRYGFETEYRVPGTESPDVPCHFTYYSSSRMKGEFNSPRFPSNYPSGTNCTYIFYVDHPHEQVRIVFDNFKLRADKFNYTDRGAYGSYCDEDWVEIWNVMSHTDDKLVGRYCGTTAPGPIESREKAEALKVIMHTDEEGVYSGFKARYVYFTAKTVFGDCGENLTQANSGELTSPKWPGKYDGPSKGEGSLTCNWYLTVRPGSRVMIHFQSFAIEGEPNGRGCPAAAVRIWEDIEDIPVELCGESLLPENRQYVSTRNTMRVTFITADKAVGAPGFQAIWTEVQDGANGAVCHHSYFRCTTSQFCIPADLRCDGIRNCGINGINDDLSDEEQCGLEFGDMNLVFSVGVGIAVTLLLIIVLCAWVQRRKRRRRRRLQLRRPPIHVCDNAGARFAAMDSV